METKERTLELLEKMEKNSRSQVLYARVQAILSLIAALCCAALLICGIKILPQLQNAAQQAETVLTNLETVTTELAQSDLCRADDISSSRRPANTQACPPVNGQTG